MTPKEFAKKIIASINPGTADISGIGDGTIKGAISEQNKKLILTTLFDDGHTSILTYGKICIINFNNAFDINVMPLSGYILPVHSLYPTVSSCLYYSGDSSIGNEEGQLYVDGNKIFLRSNISEIISKNYITGQIVFFVN